MNAEISTDPKRLDIDWIITQLRDSYWGGHLKPEQIAAAVSRSLCFGAYADGKQAGLVRVVTDGSIFSSITDVIVQENMRGQGIGTALMKAVVEHPEVKHTYSILRARENAWLFYFRCADYHVFDRRHGLMQRFPQ